VAGGRKLNCARRSGGSDGVSNYGNASLPQIDVRIAIHAFVGDVGSVKKLSDNYAGGQVLTIVTTQGFRKRQRFDAWPTHATFFVTLAGEQASSGNWFMFFHVQLKGNIDFDYTDEVPRTFDQVVQFADDMAFYQVEGYPGNWVGEGFNALMRTNIKTKIPYSSLGTWLGLH